MRIFHTELTLVVLASSMAVGSVSSARYDALQRQLDQANATLARQADERDRKIKDLEAKGRVEGQTDNVPIHNARFRSNWELGTARAITIVNALGAAGVNAMRLSAASFGEQWPVASNMADAGRQHNRRIEIVIVPDLAQVPEFDELRKALEGA